MYAGEAVVLARLGTLFYGRAAVWAELVIVCAAGTAYLAAVPRWVGRTGTLGAMQE